MIVKYKVEYWDELGCKGNMFDSGLVAGSDEKECFGHIQDFYGKDNIIEYSFRYVLDESSENVIPEDDLSEIIKDNFSWRSNESDT